jgi:hypothetical protein
VLGSSPVTPALTLACSVSGWATGAESSMPLVEGRGTGELTCSCVPATPWNRVRSGQADPGVEE